MPCILLHNPEFHPPLLIPRSRVGKILSTKILWAWVERDIWFIKSLVLLNYPSP